jgi:hypothetical protein
MENPDSKMIWVVREGLLDDVVKGWNFREYKIFYSSENAAKEIFTFIQSMNC